MSSRSFHALLVAERLFYLLQPLLTSAASSRFRHSYLWAAAVFLKWWRLAVVAFCLPLSFLTWPFEDELCRVMRGVQGLSRHWFFCTSCGWSSSSSWGSDWFSRLPLTGSFQPVWPQLWPWMLGSSHHLVLSVWRDESRQSQKAHSSPRPRLEWGLSSGPGVIIISYL